MLKSIFIRASLVFLGLAGLSAALPAAAHYIWIEQDDVHQARLFFGEYQHKEIERSPGRLDEIKSPQAWLIDADGNRQPLEATRQADHFDLGVARHRVATIIAEVLDYEIKDWTKNGHGVVKPMFYARFIPTLVASLDRPRLMLDILHTSFNGESSKTFTVYFNDKPLANAKIKAHLPNFTTTEQVTDESGSVAFPSPWTGEYVLEVIYLEKRSGEFQGQRFEAFRHRATLTFNIPEFPGNR
ncbi:MAG: hypothetical protein ABI284_03445 [Nitrosospira sp.]